ncbi:biotin/lipoyl-binding protein [candidate division KSB3 bacterium]|uniref:Biotin/lipoyl-binding protein n=1 Tax=candidate division KSB3 bacterium TaxID=2044937 RepID=A0A9D5JSW3_9BACT|nr:biotin/lipoyl-binding protein [candidate division KSB3 bacterium]MBD3323500.1 biotin/lipoyl-binding protein [candidate division KSB3 bacterium]
MKTYQVTVDGQVYEVTVEEITGTASPQRATQPSSPPPPPAPKPKASQPAAPSAPARPAPQPAPSQPKAPKPVASSAGGHQVQAPMPGKVLSVNVSQGDAVKNGDVLLILEAMKMENDIMAPADGTIASIEVKSGDSVNTGDVLVVIG